MTQTSLLQNLYQEEIYKIPSKLLIVIDKQWAEVSIDETILLEKILKALKLTLASVQILTRSEFLPKDFQAFKPDYILAFGSKLKNSDRTYEAIQTDATTIVVADALDLLDEVKKRNLWATLRQVFQN
jgi:DNA polymerase III psi subunit